MDIRLEVGQDLKWGGCIGILAVEQERENLDWGIGDEKKWLNWGVYFEGETNGFPSVFDWGWKEN